MSKHEVNSNDYWIINGNYWSKKLRNYVQALTASTTLVSCTNCTDCERCTSCTNCKDCTDCHMCVDSNCCYDCIGIIGRDLPSIVPLNSTYNYRVGTNSEGVPVHGRLCITTMVAMSFVK